MIRKYYLVLDESNYVVSIETFNVTGSIEIEMDLRPIAMNLLNCYKYENGGLVFDQAKCDALHVRRCKDAEIETLRDALYESDEIMAQTVEALMDCTSITGMVKVFAEYKSRYKERIDKRKEQRARIKELQKDEN